MANFIYPSNYTLSLIEREKVPVLTMDDPAFEIMPIRNVDSHIVSWEQKDNMKGLMQVRGINGQPGRVQNVGGKRFNMAPGVYGEYMDIDEQTLLERRPFGVADGTPITIDDLVMEKQDLLINRRIDRIRQIVWTLLSTGTFSVTNANGSVVHTDTYPAQTFTASPSSTQWRNPTTGTPLAHFRAVKLLARGKGVSFGARAKAYISQVTANYLFANTNATDIGGKRTTGLANVLGLEETNALLLKEDLPQLVIYDDGYVDDNDTYQPFIADNVAVVVGARQSGSLVGEFIMTRNASDPNMAPGPYQKVIDNVEDDAVRNLQVYDGFNGGPALYYPSAVVIMNV